ncbi:ribonuclease R [Siphonobacter sp. SORGH_AS_0500]|uniref:ribonuclease R n=1 Tax=Siphonobacter sp. SORGH_AS_0500 TaxID=1864824 RepID=UPI0028609D10|nr:ribonuclease R [Siphonobacter sp. SORGH_AS_0500]MDR6193137.1 ribonuclease R [Siphonobacter sp. SORGH_AS_0500]
MKKNSKENHTVTKEERFLNQLKAEIHSFFDINYKEAFTISELCDQMDVRGKSLREIYRLMIEELNEEGKLLFAQGKYQVDTGLRYRTGRVEHTNKNFAFVVLDDAKPDEPDVYVPTDNLNSAMDGDQVRISIWKGSKRSGYRPEGEVQEVLHRTRQEVVGTFEQMSPKYGFVYPDNRRIYTNFFIRSEDFNGVEDGQKVIAEITKFPVEGQRAEGRVKTVLGNAGDNNTEMHAILAEFGLPNEFPEHITAAAEAIPEKITPKEVKKRRDFRPITTFTIDPADAKDFDDALSMEYLENGNIRVGVHIADVTHYIQPGTELEKEAYARATSVYLVDRTVPMLPEKLSNNLCSLRPNEDKLTFSAVFELDDKARIINEWFGRTIIHSDKRFSYEEAQELLEAELTESETPATPEATDKPKGRKRKVEATVNFQKDLHVLNDLAKTLRAERFRKGAVNFETVEVKFRLDENGKPLDVYQKVRKDAHKLIEEFMLLANKRVAEFVFNLKKDEPRNTMVYRIHEAPDKDRLKTFADFALRFGYQVNVEGNIASSLNRMMTAVEGKPEQNLIENLAVRTMAKARYSTEEIGHFGLAFAHYSHFTSPIRRYPDMMAHRLLQHYLDGGNSENRNEYEGRCKHSSEREKMAAEAERASIKYKQVEFMQSHQGEVFDGMVSGVTEFGLFVEIKETASEGMIRLSDLKDDYYDLDAANFRLVGQNSGRIINFGDNVRVKVKEANLSRRIIDLELLGILTTGESPRLKPIPSSGNRGGNRGGGNRNRKPSSSSPRDKNRNSSSRKKR